ncbi:DUF4297 family anti-phage-associated protein [Acinetobacter courvalinii]|uniref:DUF4297 family anti-phage-associated protein n=1 Tax=Acinetobacter courvalinii TaxID=280147 RepID=UPI001900249B|nr:DUF4297 family anti-phage-associated protein [Acinetobacter courvalinii]MBJ8418993.1 hypothetical protein [Acinetobacter courvalinii]
MTEPNRQAIDTIRGYLYQFDNTIIQILNHQDENSRFTVEGIEDIDIEQVGNETIAVQCKYYEKSSFTPSKIKGAIIWMLRDFSKRINNQENIIQYKLFGHYQDGQDKLIQPISLDFLKESLLTTKTQEKDGKPSVVIKEHIDLGLSDEELKHFLSKLTLEIDGPTLDQQHLDIIEKLISYNICERGDAEFFYAKSIYIIRNLAKNPEENERKITKKEFIRQLKNSKKMTFDFWYAEKLTESEYCRKIRKKYFNNTSSKMNRFFLIELPTSDLFEIKEILKNISDRWSNLNTVRQPEKFCPFIYIHNISSDDLVWLKSELILDAYIVEDGYYFKGGEFNIDLYLREVLEQGNPYRTKIKFINTMDELNLILSKQLPNKKVYQIYNKKPYFETNESYDVYIKNLECLKGVLCE